MKLVPLNENAPYYAQFTGLYVRSFPENERRPLKPLIHDPTGAGQVFAVLEHDAFAGLAVLLTVGDITHIIYLAVCEECRGRGLGSEIIKAIRELFPGHRIIADLEEPEPFADNEVQRARRVRFYIRNGFAPTQIRYRWEGEDYVIYTLGGDVTREEFSLFWRKLEEKHRDFDY